MYLLWQYALYSDMSLILKRHKLDTIIPHKYKKIAVFKI